MVLMIVLTVVALVVFGLVLGSFVNALVWRVHEQDHEASKKKPNKKYQQELSIAKGRSMCSNCHHELKPLDLVPVFSWLLLRGKCRYCHKRIPDTPLPELLTAATFIVSYLCWPVPFSNTEIVVFVLWLLITVGLVALFVYDLKWYLLPNRILFPLYPLGAILAGLRIGEATDPGKTLLNTVLAILVGGGIFYVLFQVSQGKWIGGGDVKLGWLLGLVVATPLKSGLCIFVAALLGTVVSFPLLLNHRLKAKSTIPFGPFLIAGAVITMLFGTSLLNWYQHLLGIQF